MDAKRVDDDGQGCSLAVSQDSEGRHYFVALGVGRYRQVPCLPRNSGEARGLFRTAAEEESSEAALVASYGPEVAFFRLAS
jgi:hypothetical protein